MPLPERILIDTSAFCALISVDNEFHKMAKYTYERLVDWEQELWTTSYIMIETSTLVHQRLGFKPVRVLVESIHGIVKTFWIESIIHSEAWKRLADNPGADLSLVDWTTAIVAQRLKAYVFTFNKGFEKVGIPVLPR